MVEVQPRLVLVEVDEEQPVEGEKGRQIGLEVEGMGS